MHKQMRAFLLILLTVMVPGLMKAESNDFLRSTGKIYSVVAVIAIIFIGIAIFLIRLDNKLSKLENHINNEQ